MNILIKLLPIILIIVIFYLLIYNLYPRYQETIDLAKKLNELRNKEKEIKTLENLKNSLTQNPNIQQLLANKETLNLWIPDKPKTEELLLYLDGIYRAYNFVFKGVQFNVGNEAKVFNPNVLPLKTITFGINLNLPGDNLMKFIDTLEKNVRIMVIKKATLSASGNASFEVESYFLSPE